MEKHLSDKICVPVIGHNLKIFLDNLGKVQKVTNWVELRVDFLEKISEKDLVIIKKNLKIKAILTLSFCHPRLISISNLARKAFELGFDLVDVDLETVEKENIIFNEEERKHLIISHHEFKKTPSKVKLKRIISCIKKHNPRVIKISTMIETETDNLRLIELMIDRKISQEKIIIGMGEKGKITRVMGPLFGNLLTFASLGKNKTAKGQIEISKLKQIYKLIN